MKRLSAALRIAGFGLLLAVTSAHAQTTAPAPSAASIGYAKEILALKKATTMYQNAVPGLVQRVKDNLLQTNINYQKDLDEVAVKVAKELAGREQEVGNEMAKIYARSFTENELKEMVAFYKSPLGQKMLTQEPKTIEESLAFMRQWGDNFAQEIMGKFRAEMRARGKQI